MTTIETTQRTSQCCSSTATERPSHNRRDRGTPGMPPSIALLLRIALSGLAAGPVGWTGSLSG